MRHLLLLPAALVVFQAQAAERVSLPITQENHESWITPIMVLAPDQFALAKLTREFTTEAGQVLPKGTLLEGTCSTLTSSPA